MKSSLRHREKVLAHAEKQLVSKGHMDSQQLLALYKKFLKIEDHRLRLEHYAGGGGLEIAHKRATLMDIVLRHLFEAACTSSPMDDRQPPGLALLAIGGYGRGELNPFSDVDVMFLHSSPRGKEMFQISEIIQLILYLLWDIGFKVGHSTRSIPEAIKQAQADMLSKTSLLESRLLTGDEALFAQFKMQFEKQCVAGHEEEYIADRVTNQAERHSKHGGTIYMQEPNIKNGCGGLRDYQNLMWISHFKERVSTTAELVEKKFLSEAERKQLDRAHDFLLRVRTELHYLNKRAADVLTLSFQGKIADEFGYPQKNMLRRSEAFMRDYYQHARTIYNMTELLSERLSVTTPASRQRSGILKYLPQRKKNRVEFFDGFFSRGGNLYPESRDIFSQDPYRMMRLFQHAQQRHLSLSAELQQLIRRRLHLVSRTFQYSRAARETFAAILSRKGEVGRILRMMHRVDFLGRYIPEFGELTCLVQHEFFHRYTADEHTLVCIDKLDALVDTNEPKLARYRDLFLKLEDPFVLYLALLLHDTGKAANARLHAEASALYAQKVAARHQLSSERRKTLISLVDNHLALSSTAQRRNLDDAATIEEFASIVRSQGDLDNLMLLTLVDGQATGSEAWSDWKETLVWNLYNSTSQYLADGEAFFRQRKIERDSMRHSVSEKLGEDYTEEVEAYFQHMPESYFQTQQVADIVSHIRFFRTFLEARAGEDALSLAPAVKWIAHPAKGHSEVWVCTWDRRELLARIAGSFSVAKINILSADIFTRSDSLVLDIFRVCNKDFEPVTDEKDIAQFGKHLQQALSDEDYDFDPLLERVMRKQTYRLAEELDFPTRIGIDNSAHPVFTLVDIQTPDRLGLLYHLLRAFGQVGANIALSRITTEKGAAIDSFYITGEQGRKIEDPDEIKSLQKALQSAAEKSIAPE